MEPKTRLADWRETSGYTLSEIADLTGLSSGFISRLERGQRVARPETKVAMARRLGVAVSDLFEIEPLQEVGT